jgi:predicted ester cyclase
MAVMAMACGNQTPDYKEQIAVVEKYIKAVESLDYKTMQDLLADDYMGNGPSFGDTIYKAQAVESWKYNAENLYDSIKYVRSVFAPSTVTTAVAENNGDWIINWAELHIKYKNDTRDISLWAVTGYQVKNGKIAKTLTVYDEADILRQLGYQMIPPAE